MTTIVTYESKSVANPKQRWQAYAVLPNGDLWLVRCTGETEEIAATKARTLYESERAKVKPSVSDYLNKEAKSSQHHNAGKVWMVNKQTGDKKRIAESEIVQYEWAGYVRGGPRS